MMGVYLHVMADTLGSVGVILSTLLIKQFGWTGFDPIASLMIAVLIFGSVLPLLADASRILSLTLDDGVATEVARALDTLLVEQLVTSYSTPRFWPRDGESVVGSLRIQVLDPELSGVAPETSAVTVEKCLRTNIPGLVHVAVQVDWRPSSSSTPPVAPASAAAAVDAVDGGSPTWSNPPSRTISLSSSSTPGSRSASAASCSGPTATSSSLRVGPSA